MSLSPREQALRIAVHALKWYANPERWSEDDWGIKAVIHSPDYSHEHGGGQKARNALARIERLNRRGD